MTDYVNNKELYAELKIYNEQYKKSVELGEERPQISDKIGNAIIQISTRMSNSYNFVNYSYKSEMIADGILKCFSKIHSFDPEISENPFAWCSQVIWNSFILRIKKEQKESSVKAKLIRHKMSSEFVAHGADFDTDSGDNSFITFLQENDAYVDYIEQSKTAVKQLTSLKHRNKTPYKKKAEVVKKVPVYETDLSIFE
jgi:hypothetical protein